MSVVETWYNKAPAWLQNVMLNLYALRIQVHRYGPLYRSELEDALARERWSTERIRDYQDEHLRGIVRSAWEGSAFWRQRFEEERVGPRDIRGIEDLSALPILTRDEVRQHGERMMTRARPGSRWLHGHTSGTTGTPLGLWYDRQTCIMTNVVDRRQKVWGGMERDDWIGLFLGRTVVPPDRGRGPFWRMNMIQRQVWYSAFHMSEEHLASYVEDIRQRRLRFLEGYPSTLYILAQYLLDSGRELPLKAVFTSSETLHQVQEEAMEKAFGCPIFDFYGHAERTIFATECEVHEGKHVSEDFGYVEVVNASGEPVPDGELGYLTGTSLHNRAMPMLRYRTGDLSRILPEACSCGRTHRRIASVTTKAEDIVVTPEGRMISPSILTHPFKPFDSLQESQIVQDGLDHILVRLVATDAFTLADRKALQGRLQERLGPDMKITIKEVERIPRERSGKFRWVISEVAHDRQLDWSRTSAAAAEGEQLS